MVPSSYKKFYTLLALALVVSLGATSMLSPSASLTGYATAQSQSISVDWVSFSTGLGAGALIMGLMAALFFHEQRRL